MMILLLLLWLYSPLFDFGRFFSFSILYTVGRTPWTGDQPVARPLPTHRTTQTQNKCTQYGHPCLELDSNPRSRRSSEDSSCFRPRGHCDRLNSWLNAGNGFHHSVHTPVFSPVLSKNINIKIYKIINLLLFMFWRNCMKRSLGHSTEEKMWNWSDRKLENVAWLGAS
jgi:hypothetical protein